MLKIRKFVPQKLINFCVHLPRAVLANIKYGFPSKKLRVIGVTGTDGKTTTVNMIYKILKDSGRKVSMVSTINAVVGGKKYDTGFHVTTPSPFDIQKYLKSAVDNGDEFAVLEVTSHALDQYRVWGINFEIGVITNVTHEHLDYHKTFMNYLNTKKKLLKNVSFAVLNKDDQNIDILTKGINGMIITFGIKRSADVNPYNTGLKLHLPGAYNLYNALAAFAVSKVLSIDAGVAKRSLERFTSLPGRMEEIKNNLGIKIVVDFAHTPNALKQALLALKPKNKNKGKLISVFGCASERDIDKRPMMGKISGKLADITILTDEDPRFEDSLNIIEQIAEGARKTGVVEGKTLFKEPDRKKAIELALNLAQKGDVVGIFGKGHEKSMNYRGIEKPWSDQKAVQEALLRIK